MYESVSQVKMTLLKRGVVVLSVSVRRGQYCNFVEADRRNRRTSKKFEYTRDPPRNEKRLMKGVYESGGVTRSFRFLRFEWRVRLLGARFFFPLFLLFYCRIGRRLTKTQVKFLTDI